MGRLFDGVETRAAAGAATTHGWVVSEGKWSERPLAAVMTRAMAFALPLGGLLVASAVATSGRLLAGAVIGILLIALSWFLGRSLLAWSTLLRIGMRFPNRAPWRPLVAVQATFGGRLDARLDPPRGESPERAARRLLLAGLVADRTRWGGRAIRTGRLATMLAARFHWSPTDGSGIWWASLTGKLGSIGVPSGADPPAQVQRSVELLRPLTLWLGEWSRAIAEREELWSGAGIPAGLAGETIHRGARLLAVTAAYERLTSREGAGMTDSQARGDLERTAGWQFDPVMVEALQAVPKGTLRRAGGHLVGEWRNVAGLTASLVLAAVALLAGMDNDLPATGVAGVSISATSLAHASTTPLPPPSTTPATITAVVTVATTVPTPPVMMLTDDAATTFEDTAVLIDVLANDAATNVDRDSLRVTSPPTRGSARLVTGRIRYTPVPNFTGRDSLTYEACSVDAICGRATVRITIAAVDDPPGAGTIRLTVIEDQVQFFAPTATDPEGETPTCSVTRAPVHGVANVAADCSLASYRGSPDYYGTDLFEYSVAASGAATVGVVEVSVQPVNDLPVVSGVELRLDEDTTRALVLTITDPDNAAHTCRIVRPPQNGTAVMAIGCSTGAYTPSSSFAGSDAFLVSVSDAEGTTLAEVRLTIAAVDDPPTASPLALSTKVAVPAAWAPKVTDPDSGTLLCSIVVAPSHGSATVLPACTGGTYTPAAAYTGADSFTYRVSDGHSSDQATVTVAVAAGAPPVALPVAVTASEDASAPWIPSVSDPDSPVFTCTIAFRPANGTATVATDCSGGSYRPDADFAGGDAFTYTVSDGVSSDIATVTVTVTAINDPPVAAGAVLEMAEDAGQFSFALTISDVDDVTFLCTISTVPQHGSVVVAGDCSGGSYTPAADYFGPDGFAFTACDSGGLCDAASIAVTVTPVNDAPTAGSVSFAAAEGEQVTWTPAVSDVDGDVLTCSILTGPTQGSVTVAADCSGGTFTAGEDDEGFTYQVSDGSLTATAVCSVTIS